MIKITDTLSIDERDLEESFVRASGPGGQNINKVSSAVQLRFKLARAAGFSSELKSRIAKLAGYRMTKDGEVLIEAKRYRHQERNREDARNRLVHLIQRAAEPIKPRRKTKPSRAEKERRLDTKRRRGTTKRKRKSVSQAAWESGKE